MQKNNDKSLARTTQIEEGFLVLRFQNETAAEVRESYEVSSDFIQFHFCMKGRGQFCFQRRELCFSGRGREQHVLLFNPQQDLPY